MLKIYLYSLKVQKENLLSKDELLALDLYAVLSTSLGLVLWTPSSISFPCNAGFVAPTIKAPTAFLLTCWIVCWLFQPLHIVIRRPSKYWKSGEVQIVSASALKYIACITVAPFPTTIIVYVFTWDEPFLCWL